MTQGGTPFSVFTPYKNAWLKKLDPTDLHPWPVEDYAAHLAPPRDAAALPTLQDIGFEKTDLGELGLTAGMSGAQTLFRDFIERIDDYAATRDFPAIAGTSGLSPHLRFGTISIRQPATPCAGTRHPSCSRLGARAAPATRWWMPQCAS